MMQHDGRNNSEGSQLERAIEAYVDKYGMTMLLTMIENICSEKAEHVATNWGDRTLAMIWRRGAARVAKVAAFNWPL